jgi:hypothetical protein
LLASLNDAGSLLLLAFLLSDSGGLTAVDIHDVQIVPAAVVISDVNWSLLELASLSPCILLPDLLPRAF